MAQPKDMVTPEGLLRQNYHPPVRMVPGPTGPVTEKYPFLMNLWYLDPSGFRMRLAVSHGAMLRTIDQDKVNRKESKGWMRLDRCPVRHTPRVWLPESMHRDIPCDDSDLSASKPCKHLLEIEAQRRVANEAEQAKIIARGKTMQQEGKEALEKQNALLLQTMEAIANRPVHVVYEDGRQETKKPR